MNRSYKVGIAVGVLLALLIQPANAANVICTMKGAVTDSINGENIPFVTVGIETGEGKVLSRVASNENGKFKTAAPSGASYTLVFSSVGYITKRLPVTIGENEKSMDLGNILLTEGTELSEVTVVAQRPLIKSEIDKITYDMEADPEASSNNALDMLRKVPMITVDAEETIRLNGQSNYKVLLNGKSSSLMSGDNVKEVLKSMPANSIKNIEVITNPSSKYEAEGVGGIINIITATRRETDGVVGSVGANGDSFGGFGGNVYLSSQVGKFAFSGRYSGNRHTNGNGSRTIVATETYGESYYHHSSGLSTQEYKGFGQHISIEASYEIDTLNLISFSGFGWLGDNRSNSTMGYTYWNKADEIISKYDSKSDYRSNHGSVSGTLDYQHSFAKKDRMLTASYQFEYVPNNAKYNNDVTGQVGYETYKEHSDKRAHGMEHTIQLDYFDPLTKVHQIEGGLKYLLRDNVSDGDRYRDLWNEPDQLWVNEPMPIDNLNYMQHILGLYAGYVVKVDKWSGKVGLRLESTWNDGETVAIAKDGTLTKEKFTNNLFNVVPYATIAWQPKEMQTLKLSYTQRLSRPGIWQLNPFVDTSTPMQLSYGNPDLDSEVAHMFSLGYSLFTLKGINLSTEFQAGFKNNGIEQHIFMKEGLAHVTYGNIGKSQAYNLSLFFSGNLLPTLNLYTNLSGGYADYSALDEGYSNKGWSYNGFLGLRWNAWKDGAISANAGYYSGFRMLVGTSEPLSFYGFSVSQSFFDKRLQLNLSVNEPFTKERKFAMNVENEAYHINNVQYNPSRVVRLGITYRFGQMKGSVKKARRSINNDDDVKSGNSGMGGGSGSSNSGGGM